MKKFFGLFGFVFLLLASCQNAHSTKDHGQKSAEKTEAELKSQAQLIVQFSSQALLEKLQKSIEDQGLTGAVDFCKLEALAITDSLSLAFGVDIKRVSAKNRNSANAPHGEDKKYLDQFENQGELAVPVLVQVKDKYTYFAPIRVAGALCLNCHGMLNETMTSQQFEHIKESYPEDKAFGYSLGDLRGMWKITYN
jgi:hypothetical protein